MMGLDVWLVGFLTLCVCVRVPCVDMHMLYTGWGYLWSRSYMYVMYMYAYVCACMGCMGMSHVSCVESAYDERGEGNSERMTLLPLQHYSSISQSV
jgi:hypothetical protein